MPEDEHDPALLLLSVGGTASRGVSCSDRGTPHDLRHGDACVPADAVRASPVASRGRTSLRGSVTRPLPCRDAESPAHASHGALLNMCLAIRHESAARAFTNSSRLDSGSEAPRPAHADRAARARGQHRGARARREAGAGCGRRRRQRRRRRGVHRTHGGARVHVPRRQRSRSAAPLRRPGCRKKPNGPGPLLSPTSRSVGCEARFPRCPAGRRGAGVSVRSGEVSSRRCGRVGQGRVCTHEGSVRRARAGRAPARASPCDRSTAA